jgi:beta-phosphoglucomutase-like phosphatase (HAD superfamily)/dTDP-glucose pyrophosphorylase
MNILIPLGGKGSRFYSTTDTPKPLIDIFGLPMICHVLKNLYRRKDTRIFIGYYLPNVGPNFVDSIQKMYPNIEFIQLPHQTSGASETVLLCLHEMLSPSYHSLLSPRIMIMDCDTFYTDDVISLYTNLCDSHADEQFVNAVFYFDVDIDVGIHKSSPYSHILLDDKQMIRSIEEKIPISIHANTGIYAFNDIHELYRQARYVVEHNIQKNGECYLSCIVHQYVFHEPYPSIRGIQLSQDTVFVLGTPQQLQCYKDNSYLFLFDLDGTLVITDTLYQEVWRRILLDYNITMTPEIYSTYIHGNNDNTVVFNLIHNATIELVEKISTQKDFLFLQQLTTCGGIICVDGVHDFLKRVKRAGHMMAIVTNCSRTVAVAIISHLHLDEFFYTDTIIIGNECRRPKPYPDPYETAISLFHMTPDKTIIFEDSKSGLLSANSVYPKCHCIVGIETAYSPQELKEYSASISIRDFENFEITAPLQYSGGNNEYNNILAIIKNHTIIYDNHTIVDVNIHSGNKLKGGFICDVMSATVSLNRGVNIECVMKIENKTENFMTTMSKKLDLYEREYYFYDIIQNFVPVETPRCYGILRNQQYEKIGILMENLMEKKYALNLDLNFGVEPIDTALSVIRAIARLHLKFWGKPIHNIFPLLKKNTHTQFCPSWTSFVVERWPIFKSRWSKMMTDKQIVECEWIVANYAEIQEKLSDVNLTLIHGDVKSPNLFYRPTNYGYEPVFIDWQYIAHGKGVQDLVFFMIESFTIASMKRYKEIFKEYYYTKICEQNISYSREEYNQDFKYSTYYFPFFVAMWFGTIDTDELIDKNFPFFFIQKFLAFM